MMISLFDVISWVETKQNEKAIRFEPKVFAEKSFLDHTFTASSECHAIQAAHPGCSYGTARMIYSTSYGAAQVMGFNLYGRHCGYTKSIVDFMCDAIAQKDVFDKLIASMGLEHISPAALSLSAATREHFGRVYNGNGMAYASEIVLALKHYGFTIHN